MHKCRKIYEQAKNNKNARKNSRQFGKLVQHDKIPIP